MSPIVRLVCWLLRSLLAASICSCLCAQHCPPLYECYLNSTSVKKVDGALQFRSELTIEGGRGQAAFQAYLIAYLERDRARVPAPPPEDRPEDRPDSVIDPKVALVVQTKLIRRNDEFVFPIEFFVDGGKLAKQVIAHRKLSKNDRTANGGWGVYKDRIRVAIFVPMLDDKKWSVIEGLPDDRHFCNYEGERAMLFQTLPYRLSMHFGVMRAVQMKEGSLRIQINGDRPSKVRPPKKPAAKPAADKQRGGEGKDERNGKR